MSRFRISGAGQEIACEQCSYPLYSGDWAYEGEPPYERDGIFCGQACAKEPRARITLPKKEPAFRLNDHSPNTMMILGAVLSGGDPLKVAKLLVEADDDQNPPDSAKETP